MSSRRPSARTRDPAGCVAHHSRTRSPSGPSPAISRWAFAFFAESSANAASSAVRVLLHVQSPREQQHRYAGRQPQRGPVGRFGRRPSGAVDAVRNRDHPPRRQPRAAGERRGDAEPTDAFPHADPPVDQPPRQPVEGAVPVPPALGDPHAADHRRRPGELRGEPRQQVRVEQERQARRRSHPSEAPGERYGIRPPDAEGRHGHPRGVQRRPQFPVAAGADQREDMRRPAPLRQSAGDPYERPLRPAGVELRDDARQRERRCGGIGVRHARRVAA